MLVKQYINDIMNDKRRGVLSLMVKPLLLFVSCIYGFLVRGSYFFYKVNLLKSYKVPVTVLSVGNITLGGTGKTPFAIMLSRRLAQKRGKTAVLIRGYGEDEWKMLEEKLTGSGIKVFVGRNRVKSAEEALQEGVENIILDDGFQHRRLRRDLDIVLLDAASPFGNRHFFPRGILREPLAGLRRAGVIVLTKVDRAGDKARKTEEEIKRIAPGKAILKAVHRPKHLCDVWKGGIEALSLVNGRKVCALSAICDASYFRHTLERTGACVELEFVFPDHHPYKRRDLERIFKACRKKKIDSIITTEKDAVKLKKFRFFEAGSACRILALAIELEITEGEDSLDAEISRLHRGGSC